MTKVEPMHDKVKRTVAIQGQAHHIVIYEREREYDCDISCMHPSGLMPFCRLCLEEHPSMLDSNILHAKPVHDIDPSCYNFLSSRNIDASLQGTWIEYYICHSYDLFFV